MRLGFHLGLGSGRRAPFQAADLTGLVWHVDPSTMTTLYQERTSPTTLAAADLDPAGTVNDRSTSARTSTAPSDAARPTIEVAHNTARLCFDGSNDVLTAGQVTLSGAWTVAMSYQLRSTPGALAGVALLNVLTGTGEKIELLCINYAGYKTLTFSAKITSSGANGVGADVGLDTYPHRLVLTYNGGTKTSTSSYRLWFDGVEVALGASLTEVTIGGDTTAIGARYNGSAASAAAAVNVEQVIVYNDAKGDADVAKLNGLLARKRRHARTILVLGDSIAAGWVGGVGAVVKTSSWPWKVKKAYADPDEPDVINCAVPGQTTEQLLANISDYTDWLQTVGGEVQVVIGSGTNDIGTTGSLVNSGDPATAINNLYAVCDAIMAACPSAEITVQTVLPRSDGALAAGYSTRASTYNTSLAAGYNAHAAKLIDWRPIEGTITLGDGVHPTDDGYTTMATTTKTTLDA